MGGKKKGQFWLSGPFKDLKIIIDKGQIQGDLELEIDRMVFITSLNVLNYQSFETAARKLREVSQQLGLKLEFQTLGNYDMKLAITNETSLSVGNVNDFIEKLHALYQSTDEQ